MPHPDTCNTANLKTDAYTLVTAEDLNDNFLYHISAIRDRLLYGCHEVCRPEMQAMLVTLFGREDDREAQLRWLDDVLDRGHV